MIYLTLRRLMTESETAIRRHALEEAGGPRNVCGQLIADRPRYSFWRTWYGGRMLAVVERRRRERQLLALRALHLEQIHRAALVRYLAKHAVIGDRRDLTLQEFYGVIDPRRAAVAEHKAYVVAASSQVCAYELLRLAGDDRGVELLQDYQGTYGQFFAMFCDRARAARTGGRYLLEALVVDAKAEADQLRRRILGGDLLPFESVQVRGLDARRDAKAVAGFGLRRKRRLVRR